MSPTTQFLTFTPSERLASRSIAFHTSDHLEISLGGTCLHRNPHSRFSVQESPFVFDEHTVEPDHATILCSHGRILLTHQDRDGTTRINGQPLNRDQRHLLRHGDQIELGYYEPMDDEYSFTLLLRVEVSSSPPPLSSTRARFPSPDQFLPTTRSVLHASLALQDAMTQLSEALAKTRKQLQDALDREAAHTCFPPSPPRSYGSLLADLRVRAEESDSSPSARPSRSLAPSSASDSPSTSCSSSSPNDYQPSSTRSRSVTASPSVTTSVLTSVLRTEAAPSSTATLSVESTPPSPPSSITASVSSSLPKPTTLSPTSSSTSVAVLNSELRSASPSSSRLPTAPSSASVSPSSTLVLTSAPQSGSGSSCTLPPPSGTSPSTSVLRSDPASACTSPSPSATSPSATSAPTSPSTSSTTSLSASTSTSVLTSVLKSDPPLSSTASSFPSSMSPSAAGSRRRKPALVNNLASVIGAEPVARIGALSLTSAMKAVEKIRGAWLRARASTMHTSHPTPDGHIQQSSGSIQVALNRVQQAWTDVRAPVIAATCFPATSSDPAPALDCSSTPVVEHIAHCPQASSSQSSSHTSSFLTPPTAASRTFASHHSPCTTTPRCRNSSQFLRVLLDGLHVLLMSSSHGPLPHHSPFLGPEHHSTGHTQDFNLSRSRTIIPAL